MQTTILKNLKKLRKITSASIMECKKAIIFSKGNINVGLSYLIHKSNKQAKNTRNKTKLKRNFILCRRNKTKTKIIALILATETDFVTKNDLFQKLSTLILEVACLCNKKSELLKYKIKNLSLFQIITYFSKSIIQENIEVKTFVAIKNSFLNFYIYHNLNKASILGFSNYLPGIEYISKYLAMQLVANENKINTYVRNNIIKFFQLKHITYI
ncbi:hypothetical protein ACT2CD_00345 [Candidatus Karelsulcia muelleri]